MIKNIDATPNSLAVNENSTDNVKVTSVYENQSNIDTEHLSPESMRDDLLGKIESNINDREHVWSPETERLVQQISLRYAHEILNALTPVYGILQMLLTDQEGVKSLEKKQVLLQIAQEEIMKGKNHVNDFLTINYQSTPKPQWMNLFDLKLYIKNKIHRQSPEFIPHIHFEVKGDGAKEIYVDINQLRIIITLIIKKWIDFAAEPSVIFVIFETDDDSFSLHMSLSEVDNMTEMKDDEFLFYLHLINRSLERNDGQLLVSEGLTLQYEIPKKVDEEIAILDT
ncbi:hypothetical protein ACERII_16495 [Evansella sp. AB-rgal1]|uniref:hypothetical protein n=1 Tax=Evansella sp. AB-rgal1 TaxID=3242696 RepID=UPI00359D068C